MNEGPPERWVMIAKTRGGVERVESFPTEGPAEFRAELFRSWGFFVRVRREILTDGEWRREP